MVYEPLGKNFNREDDIKYIYCFSYSYWVPGTVVGSVYILQNIEYIYSVYSLFIEYTPYYVETYTLLGEIIFQLVHSTFTEKPLYVKYYDWLRGSIKMKKCMIPLFQKLN